MSGSSYPTDVEWVFILWKRLERKRFFWEAARKMLELGGLTDVVRLSALPDAVQVRQSNRAPTGYSELVVEYIEALSKLNERQRSQFKALKEAHKKEKAR